MKNEEFKTYLAKFEKEIIVQGIQSGKLGKTMMVPIRRGKLDSTDFGKKLGTVFAYAEPAAIDYYGFIKKSSGLIDNFASNTEMQIRAIKAPMVHFASIKIEYVSDLSSELVEGFPEFKKELVLLRGFKEKRNNVNSKHESKT
jgi:hypothetical protein